MTSEKSMVIILFAFLLAFAAALIFLKPAPTSPTTPTFFQIYFSKARGSEMTVEAVNREFKAPLDAVLIERRVKWAIDQLLKGPTQEEEAKGYFTDIPRETTVKKVYSKANEIYVDLSLQFETGGGSSSMLQRVSELQHTIDAVPGLNNPVHLLIEGHKDDTVGGEGLEIPDPFVTK